VIEIGANLKEVLIVVALVACFIGFLWAIR